MGGAWRFHIAGGDLVWVSDATSGKGNYWRRHTKYDKTSNTALD